MENKYLLFYGYNYYPKGGWKDFKGYFDSLDDCKFYLKMKEKDASYMWAHIVFNYKIVLIGETKDCLIDNDYSWIWEEIED